MGPKPRPPIPTGKIRYPLYRRLSGPHAPAAYTHGKDPVRVVQEAEWAPGPVWTGAENLASTGIGSPDCPARSQ